MRGMAVLLLMAALAWADKKPPAVAAKGASLDVAAPVNVNTATQEQLQTLPGIGPVMARDIVRYRQRNGPFRRVEELLIIRGMSRKKLGRLKPYVRVH